MARDQSKALARVLKPVLGDVTPSPESVRALASLFGGGTGFVSHDVILGLVRVPQSVLTNRLYSLFPRHTLEELFQLLANVKNRVRVRTPRSATTTAKTLTEKEARLEFAFELYDLDGDGLVTFAEATEALDALRRASADHRAAATAPPADGAAVAKRLLHAGAMASVLDVLSALLRMPPSLPTLSSK